MNPLSYLKFFMNLFDRNKIKKDNANKLILEIKEQLKNEIKFKKATEKNWDLICKNISDLRFEINSIKILELEEAKKLDKGIENELLPLIKKIVDEKPKDYYVNKENNFKIKLIAISFYMLNYGSKGNSHSSGSNRLFNLIMFGSSSTGINPVIKNIVFNRKVDLDNSFPFYYKDNYLDLHNENRYDWEEYFYWENN